MKRDKKFEKIITNYLKNYTVTNSNGNNWYLCRNGYKVKFKKRSSFLSKVSGVEDCKRYFSTFFGKDSEQFVGEWYVKKVGQTLKKARQHLKLERFERKVINNDVITIYKKSGRKVKSKYLDNLVNTPGVEGTRSFYNEWIKLNNDIAIKKFLDLDNCVVKGNLTEGCFIYNKKTKEKQNYYTLNGFVKKVLRNSNMLNDWYHNQAIAVSTRVMNLDKYEVIANEDSIGLTIISGDDKYSKPELLTKFATLHKNQQIFDEWFKTKVEGISTDVLMKQLDGIEIVDSIHGWSVKTKDGNITSFDDFFNIISSHFSNIDDVMKQVTEWYEKGVIEKSEKLMWE